MSNEIENDVREKAGEWVENLDKVSDLLGEYKTVLDNEMFHHYTPDALSEKLNEIVKMTDFLNQVAAEAERINNKR